MSEVSKRANYGFKTTKNGDQVFSVNVFKIRTKLRKNDWSDRYVFIKSQLKTRDYQNILNLPKEKIEA